MIRIELDFEQGDKIVVESLTKYYNSECNDITSERDEDLLASIETVLKSYMSTSEYRAWKAEEVDTFKSIEQGLKEAVVYAGSNITTGYDLTEYVDDTEEVKRAIKECEDYLSKVRYIEDRLVKLKYRLVYPNDPVYSEYGY
jgi:hypothetical protein